MQKDGIVIKKKLLVIFICPVLVLYTLFIIIPTIQSLYYSFFEWNGISTPEFIAFDNYINMFKDDYFLISIRNIIIYIFVLLCYQMVFGFLLALITSDKRFIGKVFIKKVIFIPFLIAVTIICQLWIRIVQPVNGVLNIIFEFVGLPAQKWIMQDVLSMFLISFIQGWHHIGFYAILFSAAISSIPAQLYNAAKLEGANTMQQHLYITIPLLKDTFLIAIIFCIAGGMKSFEYVYIMTGGGPGNISYTLSMFIYRCIFKTYNYGYGTTGSVIMLITLILATILLNRLGRSRITY